ncbi:hypothetical protein A2331_01895 [Candidatus Falkowbacteria bacterium RIFOXYB2_FULL_34_18]|uniref:Amino acid transporter transmembrane domain-containing protein n=1 Tax=Candidatus Falkowbacteria bacterium RIFOXYD2_FULL_34_120 TaxID=1798007 RepID=A0A1F5TQG6_9BACT|nr:MAG: hypothetical protein A2331_01895 [Candidatus Falkowbacteria bacterium RIFOXYB2_FULL_34_18]OGF29438.1 MAG: hypothetical protein A2500_00960 [Candidatus Falkowbacteria bacterium RIFOXYC12_FULL_34_55]OGF36751.1 MAG: hypothetical protein A2466_03270 [Candidatus Falkowbacteria bacterium RIFOXYC2_FULL_34_220]OGF38964.1 MAG: hypothetical protein A2515_05385 [Candidatus Falkowbacteria bacterium RIFOXYD12_FULL_34_57]OGF41156.1 MAG: hypothetical protein A2531_01385 [Candidatus Falkowbacteria bact
MKRSKNYYRAIAVMVGYIVGVGMFGLPFLTVKAGVFSFFIFLVSLGLVQYLLHIVYANLIIETPGFHRMPGYVGIYMGKGGKISVFIAKLIGNYGALLAYIIVSGNFLYQLLNKFWGGTPFIYATIVFGLESIIVFFGIKAIARAELYISTLLLLVVGLMAVRGWGVIDIENFTSLNIKNIILPYGAMLMALDGAGSLPIVAKLVNKNKTEIKSIIRVSMIISIIITTVFTLTIVGISGAQTSEDALTGVRSVLDDGVIVLALIFGVFSMMTSVFGVAESVKETLWWDFKVNEKLSWFLAVSVPYLLYCLGLTSLVRVISFIGAVGGGFAAIMLILVFKKLKKQDKLSLFTIKPHKFLLYLLIFLFTCGMLYELYFFFK